MGRRYGPKWNERPSSTSLCFFVLIYYTLRHGLIAVDAFSVRGRRSTLDYHHIALSSTKNEIAHERIRAAVYQPPAPLVANKTTQHNCLEILTQVTDVLRMASKCGIDIVVFPEMYLNGGPNRVLSGTSGSLDRESYELNILGNLCGDLNIACVAGYAESRHESELKPGEEKGGMYNSIAAFNADGSRAGNYRCVTKYKALDSLSSVKTNMEFMKGNLFVEALPTSIHLPIRQENEKFEKESGAREITAGMMCGGDLLVPEHSRHLARSGAQILLALASLQNEGDAVANAILPTRSMENEVPFLFANYVDRDKDENDREGVKIDEFVGFTGSSAIISKNGSELVRAPVSEFGDLPCDSGYLLPCEVGALYAADIKLETPERDENSLNRGAAIQNSMEQWDLTPRIDLEISGGGKKNRKKDLGFGRVDQKCAERRKKGK